jgi:hypothetical protein
MKKQNEFGKKKIKGDSNSTCDLKQKISSQRKRKRKRKVSRS